MEKPKFLKERKGLITTIVGCILWASFIAVTNITQHGFRVVITEGLAPFAFLLLSLIALYSLVFQKPLYFRDTRKDPTAPLVFSESDVQAALIGGAWLQLAIAFWMSAACSNSVALALLGFLCLYLSNAAYQSQTAIDREGTGLEGTPSENSPESEKGV